MSLQQLRVQAKQQANRLYQGCMDQHKGHPLLRSGRFNSGIWRQKWEKTSQKNSTCAQATLYSAFLPLELSKKSGVKALWPWETRNKILAKEQTKNWLSALLKLDGRSTIFVDLVPDLGIWICDVFNYIPRDVWSLSAQLIARFYRSSKQLYFSMYPDGDARRQEFFFSKIDASLSELFDFSVPAKKGTIRKVFSTISEDEANRRYGEHSHVHRHGMYLLIQIGILDGDWRQQLFHVQKNSFSKHLLNIKDDSCLSVLYTGLLEIAYFDGHKSELDWSLFQGLEGLDVGAIQELPVKTESLAEPTLRTASETEIRKKVLKIRAVKSNIQLVGRLYTVNQAASASQLHDDIEQWYSADGVKVDWHEIRYDYLAKWHDVFRRSKPTGTCILYERLQYLQNLCPSEQRELLIRCYKIFVGTQEYALLTCGERKRAFFDIWFLLSVGNMFDGGFSTVLLDTTVPSIFGDVPGLNESIVTYVKRTYAATNKSKEIGKIKYTKQIILLAILVQAQRISYHQDELAQLIREGFLEDLFVLSEMYKKDLKSPKKDSEELEKDSQKKKTITEQVFGDLGFNTRFYAASPIAIWMMTNERFRGSRTPLIFQVIQSFLIGCTTEEQKFNLFYRLSLYESDHEIYKIFSKNLYFPFHLLGAPSVQYTQVNWGDLCTQLAKHEKGRRELEKRVLTNEKNAQNNVFYQNLEDVLDGFNHIWDTFLSTHTSNLALNLATPWKKNLWDEMSLLRKEWLSNKDPIDYLEFKPSEEKLIQFFYNVEIFVSSIPHEANRNENGEVEEVHRFVSLLKVLCTELDKGTEIDFDAELIRLKSCSPHALRRQVPYELNLMYRSVVEKLHRVMTQVVSNEKNYLEWDKEIQSPFISFEKLQLKLQGKEGYWNHALKVFEATSVEKFVSQTWIDNLIYQSDWTSDRFTVALASFEGVFEGYPRDRREAYEILTQKILEQPKKLGVIYSPLLKVIQKRVKTLHQQGKKEDSSAKGSTRIDNQMILVDRTLRDQGLHGLARDFSAGHSISFIGKGLRFGMNHGLSPFIAAVVSLTLLLDFGGSLLNLYTDNIVASVLSIVASLAFAFGYPYVAKHREMGVLFKDSVKNIMPSFGVSVVMSWALSVIWTMADAEASFGVPAVLLMLFFTTIVKAATDGAFDTDKD